MSEGAAPKAKILVVDDNEANRALARETLEDEGYEVVLATGGKEGLAAFEREHPDCVLLDVRMPDMEGPEVCSRIRATEVGADTPIVFVTALRDVDTFDSALGAGGDDFLTKPVRPSELLVRVESALKLRRLRTELRDHYELLKQQRNDLLRLSLVKERLMAFVVHDLKNPVNSMDLHAQLLLRDKELSERSRNSATQIRNEARQLNRMILNLLDLSKADEGKLVPKRSTVDLAALVGEAVAELEIAAIGKNVTLEPQVASGTIDADPDLLRRAIANVIENAIRHAPGGSAIQIPVTRTTSATEIRVIDHGVGIPVEMRERIFDPFLQIEEHGSGQSSRGGRGLGLAFCKLTAEAHGGKIRVEDGNPGAVFIMSFPHA